MYIYECVHIMCTAILGNLAKNAELAFSSMLPFTLQKLLENDRVEYLKELIGEVCVGIDSCLLFKAQSCHFSAKIAHT